MLSGGGIVATRQCGEARIQVHWEGCQVELAQERDAYEERGNLEESLAQSYDSDAVAKTSKRRRDAVLGLCRIVGILPFRPSSSHHLIQRSQYAAAATIYQTNWRSFSSSSPSIYVAWVGVWNKYFRGSADW